MQSISHLIRSMVVAIAFAPQLAHSQQQAALHVGDFSRISSAGRSTEGKVAWVGRDSVTLVSGDHTVTVPVFASDTVWTRHRQAGKGAIIGATFGGLAFGALLGTLAAGLCESDDCSRAFPGGFVVGGVIGAGSGGLVGAGIGSLVQKWRRVRP